MEIRVRAISGGKYHEVIVTETNAEISSGLLDEIESQRMAVELTEAVEVLLDCEIELPIRRDI